MKELLVHKKILKVTCYLVMILLITFSYKSLVAQTDCDNMGFENGDLSEWVAGRGCNENARASIFNDRGVCHDNQSPWFRTCCPFDAQLSTDESLFDWESRHTMISKGRDPYCGFDLVAPQLKGYPKSNYSLRLGNARPWGQADMIERTFTVDETNAIFAYQFAFVLNDPKTNHSEEQLPFFESGIYDANGGKVPCSYLKVLANNTKFDSVIADSVIDTNTGTSMVVRYKNWNPIFINLTDRIGEELTIRFKDVDCGLGGHWGYSYITAYCGKYVPMKDTTICANEPVTLTSPFPIEGFHLEWSTGETTEQITVNPSETTTITLKVKNRTTFDGLDEDCEETYSVTITVLGGDPPVLKDTTVCFGESVTLNAEPNAVNYNWYTTPTGGTPFHQGSSYTTPPLTSKVTYYVMNPAKCSSDERVPVTVDVIVVTADAGDDKIICNGEEVMLEASGGDIYLWSPDDGSLNNINIQNPLASPVATTTYTVRVTDATGICFAEDDVTVFVQEIIPKIEGVDVCIGNSTTFVNNTLPLNLGNVSWLWDFGDGNSSSEQAPTHTYESAGEYEVSLNVKAGVCENSTSTTVEVYPDPIAAFTPNPRKTTADNPVITFYDESRGVQTGVWNFGDGTESVYVPNKDEIHAYYATNEDEGPFKYTIRLSVESEHGCKDETVREIEIENVWTIYVPNSFTPNGDGINDYFKAFGMGILDFQMTIFNRWGEVVFRSTDLNRGWDGTPISGSGVKQDVYVWKVKAKNNRGKIIKLVGHVTLTR